MKRVSTIALAIAFCCGVIFAPQAEASWFGKKKPERTEMPEWMKKARRFDNSPKMGFVAGELERDGWSGWKVGGVNVQLSKNCLVMMDGVEGASLDSGRNVVVMGPRSGNTIVAWNINVAKPSFSVSRTLSYDTQLAPSNNSSDCGEVISAPR